MSMYGTDHPHVPDLDPWADPPEEPRLVVVTAADVTPRRVRYLWDRRIPIGAATLMPGEEGIGKTAVGVRLIADLTRGTLAGEHYGTPRDCIVLATEDGLEDVFVPRLIEAGADLSRVHIVRARVGMDGKPSEVIVPRDLALLSDLVSEHRAVLVWIDSLVTTLPDDLKSIAYKDTAKVLRTLGNWAESRRVALVAPWHLNKAAGSDTAVRIMDSRAFRTAVRAMLLVVPDPDAPEGTTQGIVALDKANAGTLHVPALRYRIRVASYVVDELDEDTGQVRQVPGSCAVADWVGEVEGDGRSIAREALAPRIEKVGTASQWLRDYLTEEGETARPAVIEAAAAAGFSIDAVKRAARAVGVQSRDESGRDEDTGHPWRRALWSLPSGAGGGSQWVHTPPDRPYRTYREDIHPPTTPIGAGQAQSVQSVRSGVCSPTGEKGAPTGERPRDDLDERPPCPRCARRMGRAEQAAGMCRPCHRIAEKESAR